MAGSQKPQKDQHHIIGCIGSRVERASQKSQEYRGKAGSNGDCAWNQVGSVEVI